MEVDEPNKDARQHDQRFNNYKDTQITYSIEKGYEIVQKPHPWLTVGNFGFNITNNFEPYWHKQPNQRNILSCIDFSKPLIPFPFENQNEIDEIEQISKIPETIGRLLFFPLFPLVVFTPSLLILLHGCKEPNFNNSSICPPFTSSISIFLELEILCSLFEKRNTHTVDYYSNVKSIFKKSMEESLEKFQRWCAYKPITILGNKLFSNPLRNLTNAEEILLQKFATQITLYICECIQHFEIRLLRDSPYGNQIDFSSEEIKQFVSQPFLPNLESHQNIWTSQKQYEFFNKGADYMQQLIRVNGLADFLNIPENINQNDMYYGIPKQLLRFALILNVRLDPKNKIAKKKNPQKWKQFLAQQTKNKQ